MQFERSLLAGNWPVMLALVSSYFSVEVDIKI
jgi:hypothetical protein